MALKRQHDLMASYSMASMTDVIFLLLIFFMVTSTFVSPTALEVDLPKSSEQTAVKKPSTKVYIDKTQQLYASFGEESPQAIQDDQLLAFLQMTQQQASGWIAQQITNQGLIISANEIFWMSAGIFLVLLGLVWFAKPPFGAGGGGGGAH